MDGRSPYSRYNKNWVIAKESLERKMQIRQKQLVAMAGESYYGGVPYWMNQRKRNSDAFVPNQFLLVNKLETSTSIFSTEVPKTQKNSFRISTRSQRPKLSSKVQENVQNLKITTHKKQGSSTSNLNSKPISSGKIFRTEPILPTVKEQPSIQTPIKREESPAPEEPELYLPAPRIIYETYGPSN
jgi:hypothetical protein